MTGNDFVKEMQKALLTQQEHDDPASRANLKVSQTEAHEDWDTLVAWMEGKHHFADVIFRLGTSTFLSPLSLLASESPITMEEDS